MPQAPGSSASSSSRRRGAGGQGARSARAAATIDAGRRMTVARRGQGVCVDGRRGRQRAIERGRAARRQVSSATTRSRPPRRYRGVLAASGVALPRTTRPANPRRRTRAARTTVRRPAVRRPRAAGPRGRVGSGDGVLNRWSHRRSCRMCRGLRGGAGGVARGGGGAWPPGGGGPRRGRRAAVAAARVSPPAPRALPRSREGRRCGGRVPSACASRDRRRPAERVVSVPRCAPDLVQSEALTRGRSRRSARHWTANPTRSQARLPRRPRSGKPGIAPPSSHNRASHTTLDAPRAFPRRIHDRSALPTGRAGAPIRLAAPVRRPRIADPDQRSVPRPRSAGQRARKRTCAGALRVSHVRIVIWRPKRVSPPAIADRAGSSCGDG